MSESRELEGCECCPLTEMRERRAFLRDAASTVIGMFAALGVSPSVARALPLRVAAAIARRGDERVYPIPASDGAVIDKKESIIVMRWQDKAYAFSLACPHQNTALRWEEDDARFQCPKHHSKYRPDGSFIEGRATRGMDRFAVRREGDTMVVDIDQLFRQDESAAGWKSALIQL